MISMFLIYGKGCFHYILLPNVDVKDVPAQFWDAKKKGVGTEKHVLVPYCMSRSISILNHLPDWRLTIGKSIYIPIPVNIFPEGKK